MSEITTGVRQAIFWLKKRTGWLRNRCAHTLLPYERVRKIAVLIHCGEEEHTGEVAQLAHLLAKEGKQVFPVLYGGKDDQYPLPPILKRKSALLWEKRSRRRAMAQEYDILIDATKTDETALQYALHNLRAKSKMSVRGHTKKCIHDVVFVRRENTPLAGIHEYLPRMG